VLWELVGSWIGRLVLASAGLLRGLVDSGRIYGELCLPASYW
jgi:hypothetical protein